MEEKILISLEISKPEGEKQVDELTKKIVNLTKANADLAKEQKELTKQGQENSQQYLDNSRQIEINKQKIQEATASRKGLISSLVAEDNSIKALQVRNKELTNQRNLLSTSTEDGRKKIAAINKEIDLNNKAINENSTNLEKQRFNIGNYKSAIDGLIPGFSGMVDGIGSTTKAGLAFIATPIGAVLAAVALALGAVISYLKGSEEGMDTLAKVTAQASAVIDVLTGRVIQLGKGLVSFLSGDYQKGINEMAGAFEGLGDEIEREVKLAGELADVFDQLEERELSQSLRLSEQANKIKLLMIESKNRALSEEERSKKLNEALALEGQLNKENLKIQEDRIDATARDIQRRFSQFALEKQAGESAIDFAKRISANEGIVFDERKALVDQLIKYNDISNESANITEKITNQQDALNEKYQTRIEKEQQINAEAAKYVEGVVAKIEADRLKAEQEAADQAVRTQMADDFIAQTGANSEISLNIAQREFDRKKKLGEDERKFEKQSLDIKKDLNKQELQNMESVLGVATTLFKRKTAAFKATAIGQAIINTYLAASSALAPPPLGLGPVAGIPLAVVTIAAGLVNVARIAGVEFARGGILGMKRFAMGGIAHTGGVLRGPTHARGGIPFTVAGQGGFEAEGGEAIINRRSTRMFKPVLSAINQAGGGVPFERGGLTRFQTGGAFATVQTRQAFQAASNRFDMNRLEELMSRVQTVLVLEDFEAKQGDVNTNRGRATIM